jgi:hypothetical protein
MIRLLFSKATGCMPLPHSLQRPKPRPAWALSSEEADIQLADEEAALLGFVGGLDFGGYVKELDAKLVGYLPPLAVLCVLVLLPA